MVLLAAGYLRAAQTAGNLCLNALGPKSHAPADAALHGPAEAYAALQLGGDVLGHQLGVQIRLANLDDVDDHGLAQHLLALLAELLYLRAALAYDHAGLCAVDMDAHLGGVALDLYLRDARLVQLLFQDLPQVIVLYQSVAEVVVLGEPPGIPVLYHTHAKAVGIDFLSHNVPPYSFSATTMVMWLVRFRILCALPWSFGRILLRIGPGVT